MNKVQFIRKLKSWIKKIGVEDDRISIGCDFSLDYRLLIDKDGTLWIRECESWIRHKTTINVDNVVEFRHAKPERDGFFIICNDNTGLYIEDEYEIYYYVDGSPSGWGPAEHHFKEFPVE